MPGDLRQRPAWKVVFMELDEEIVNLNLAVAELKWNLDKDEGLILGTEAPKRARPYMRATAVGQHSTSTASSAFARAATRSPKGGCLKG